jgi:hypothetical protein
MANEQNNKFGTLPPNPATILCERVLCDLINAEFTQKNPTPAALAELAEWHMGTVQTYMVRISVAAFSGDMDRDLPDYAPILSALTSHTLAEALAAVTGHVWGAGPMRQIRQACDDIIRQGDRYGEGPPVSDVGVW